MEAILTAYEVAHAFRHPGLRQVWAARVNGRIRISASQDADSVLVGAFDGSVDVAALEQEAHFALLAAGK